MGAVRKEKAQNGGSKPRAPSPASVGVVKNNLAVFALVEDGVVCGAADSDDAVDIGDAAFFHKAFR